MMQYTDGTPDGQMTHVVKTRDGGQAKYRVTGTKPPPEMGFGDLVHVQYEDATIAFVNNFFFVLTKDAVSISKDGGGQGCDR